MRDETNLSDLRLAIDLKQGTDPDKLMQKLFRTTPSRTPSPVPSNILVDGMPKVMGVGRFWTGGPPGGLTASGGQPSSP